MKIQTLPLMRYLLPYILLLWLFSAIGYSQDVGSCAEKLKTAQSLFDKGQVDQVPSMLYDCMKSGFNREESLSAYKLLIQAYLFEEKLELADSTMLTFLEKNPEYKISPTDHSSFVNLYNDFIVKPVVQIGFHFGTSLPFLTFINPVSTVSGPINSHYSSKALNLFGSIEARFELTKKIELNFEAGYSQLAFTNVEDFMGIYKVNYKETQTRIEIPFTGTYNFKNFNKLTPYARLGVGAALTVGSTAQGSDAPVDLNNKNSHTGSDINRKDSRISLDLFTQIGGGIKYKTRGGYITAELRSNLGFRNQTIRGGVPDAELNLPFFYYYVDDDFHLNSINFSLGYTRIFYKPTKRKE